MTIAIHDCPQGSPEWFTLRAGRPTASEFSRIITSTGKPSTQMDKYAAQLAAERVAGRPLDRWEGNQWTKRGKELEAEALEAYAFDFGVEVARVGFVSNGDVGCSPDGLIGTEGLVEVKCLSPAEHVLAYAFYQRNRAPPSDYVAQNRGQMFVCERAWNDMWFYYPDPSIPSFAIRLHRNPQFDESLADLLAETLGRRNAYVNLLRGET